MIRKAHHGLAAVLVVAATACGLTLVAGCGRSAPTHFFSLSPAVSEKAAPPAGPCQSIGIGPVDFPAYLDRSQIVTRLGPNQLHLAEFDQWAEPLRDNFQRALAENLAGLVCAKPLVTYPWPVGGHPDKQITIQVARFDGTPGGHATLRTSWSVVDPDGNSLAWRSMEYQEAVAGPGYDALAAAQSKLVEKFAKDVADTLHQ